MSAKHTPGPWVVEVERVAEARIVGGDVTVALVLNDAPSHDHEAARAWRADASLIAAAPDLLEALEQLANRVDPGTKGRNISIASFVAALEAARAAITKARGEQ